MYVMVVKFVFPFLHVQFSKKFQWKGRLRTVTNYNKEISLKFEVSLFIHKYIAVRKLNCVFMLHNKVTQGYCIFCSQSAAFFLCKFA